MRSTSTTRAEDDLFVERFDLAVVDEHDDLVSGDTTLSITISKALLLAGDRSITDRVIVSQIRERVSGS
jgi:hypothetical protein